MVLKKGTGQYFLILHPSSPLYFWRSEGGGEGRPLIFQTGFRGAEGGLEGGKDGAAFLRGRREEGGRGWGGGGGRVLCIFFGMGGRGGKIYFSFSLFLDRNFHHLRISTLMECYFW